MLPTPAHTFGVGLRVRRGWKREDLQVRVTEGVCRVQNSAQASALSEEVRRRPSPKQAAGDGRVWRDR